MSLDVPHFVFAHIPIAFGFVNLTLLGWLAAAAAPILIHLWMRHARRETPWAAMDFLREALKRHARRLRLQQWILLALRTLVIILIVLAAAKPFVSGWNLLGVGPKVHRLLVFDASMSMQYESDGQTRFARAKQLARDLIEQVPTGGVYSLCVMGDPPRGLVSHPTADRDHLLREIHNLEATAGTSSLRDLLVVVEQMLGEAARVRDIERHEIIIFSDLAGHAWEEATVDESGAPVDAQIARQLDSIGRLADVVVVDVGGAAGINTAVSQLAVAGTLATTAEPVEVAAQVTNHADAPIERLSLQLLVDGRTIDEQTTGLGPRQSTTVSFMVPFDTPGWHSLSLKSGGDALPLDDEAYLALEVPDRMRILCVEGEPKAARYVARALNPSGGPTSPLEPVVVAEGSLVELPLSEYRCLFVCNVARFSPDEAMLLSSYVGQGGGLVIFLGDRVLADDYNAAFVQQDPLRLPVRTVALQSSERDQPDKVSGLLPATIGEVVTSDNSSIDPLGYNHPIVAAFQGRERAGLLTTPITTYLKLQPREEQGAEVAFATSNADPLLVTKKYGKGTVVLIATAASLDTVDPVTSQPWTLLPAWPSFLPIVREVVAYASSQASSDSSQYVGSTLEGYLPAQWARPSVQVTRPEGRIDVIPVERAGQEVSWTYGSTELPGIYSAHPAAESSPLSMAAINVDPRESDLTQVDISQLTPRLSLRKDLPGDEGSEGHLSAPTPLHRWLLHVALALLLVESIVAWWFGRGAA